MSFFENEMKKLTAGGGMTPYNSNPLNEEEEEKQGPQYSSPFQAGLAQVEKAGGALLTSTLKGLSYFGQSVLGTLEYLEASGNYDEFYKNEDGKVRFQWDQVDDFVKGAIDAGDAQGRRVIQSRNMQELMNNVTSGTAILQNMPGQLGEFFRNEDTRSKRFLNGTMGLALEIITDPSSLIGGVVGKGVTAVAKGAPKIAGMMGGQGAEFLGGLAGSIASGNAVAGSTANGLRATAYASRQKLLTLANNKMGTRTGRAAETILEWGMGPQSLATNGEMQKVLAKYAALKEDLPKEMLTVANTAATITAKLPERNRSAAQKAFGQLAAASDEATESKALDVLERLGVGRSDAAQIGNKFREANLRLVDILTEAKGTMPGFDMELSQYHLRRSYRMFVDPNLRMDWLDHLVKVNTPASFQIKQTELRTRLMANLNINDNEPGFDYKFGPKKGEFDYSFPDPKKEGFDYNFESKSPGFDKVDMQFGPDKANSGSYVGGSSTFGKTGMTANRTGERQARLQLEISKAEELIANPPPGKDVSQYVKLRDKLVKQADKLAKSVGMEDAADAPIPKKIDSLQRQIGVLNGAIGESSERQREKFIVRRNSLQAQLDWEIDKLNASGVNVGNPAARGRPLSEATIGWVAKQSEELERLEARHAGLTDPVKKTQLKQIIERKRKTIADRTGMDYNVQDNISVGDLQDLSVGREVASKFRGDSGEVDSLDNIQRQWMEGSIEAGRGAMREPSQAGPMSDWAKNDLRMPPKFSNFDYDVSGAGAKDTSFDFNFGAMKDELLPEEKRFLPSVDKIKHQQRTQFLDDFSRFVAEDDELAKQSFVGFKFDENNVPQASFDDNVKKAKGKTLEHIGNWITDWAERNGIEEAEKDNLVANITNTLAYVPGSKEFSHAVRTKGESLSSLDPELARIISNELGVTAVNKSSLQDRTLDPIYHELFGKIDDFSVRSAEQGVLVGDLAARASLFTEMRKRGLVMTAEEIQKAGLPMGGFDDVSKFYKQPDGEGVKYYVQHTNARAIQAIDRSLGELQEGKGIGRAAAGLANLFRRAALVTDPSAHATQFMGNIAMLQMMGYNDMFRNPVRFVRDMNASFKSVMLYDDTFKEAVDSGLQVTQTILSEAQMQRLARSLVTIPTTGTVNGDRVGAMGNLFRIAKDVLSDVPEQAARQMTNVTAGGIKAVTGMNGADAVQVATNVVSPAAMFQLSDQMTRLYAYRNAVSKGVQDLAAGNPILRGLTTDGGTKINWEAVEKKARDTMPADKAEEIIGTLKEAHKNLREEAAKIGNDVALNYSDVPLAVNYLSKTGVVPFIKFQYKATGRVMEWMSEKPWVFSPYYQAQRNFNESMNPDPDEFDRQRASLSSSVRDSLVIPTGGRDSLGRQEFLDLSRWLPFGMFVRSANGGGGEPGLAAEPSSLVSTPTLDLYHAIITEDGMQPGQSKAAFIAQKLTETFAPAGIAPGGRKIEALAKAIEQSYTYIGEDGLPVSREPSKFEQTIVNAAALPEKVGYSVDSVLNPNQASLTTPTGTVNPASELRPRTTVEQSWQRYAVPGAGFSTDPGKTYTENDRRYEVRINSLKQQLGKLQNNTQGIPTVQQMDQWERIQRQIEKLEQMKQTSGRNLIMGE